MIRLGSRKCCLEFVHAHDRNKPDKEQEEGEENAKRSGCRQDVDERGVEVFPGRRQEVVGERRGDDHESLEPHADIAKDRKKEDQREAAADRLKPEELGHREVDRKAGNGVPSTASGEAFPESTAFEGVRAIPSIE